MWTARENRCWSWIVEEFRQPVVDRAVLSALNLGMNVRLGHGMLHKESRDMIGGRVLDRLVTAERRLGKDYQVRSIIQMQAACLIPARRLGLPSIPVQVVMQQELRT